MRMGSGVMAERFPSARKMGAARLNLSDWREVTAS
jgi:hypothetical protein